MNVINKSSTLKDLGSSPVVSLQTFKTFKVVAAADRLDNAQLAYHCVKNNMQ